MNNKKFPFPILPTAKKDHHQVLFRKHWYELLIYNELGTICHALLESLPNWDITSRVISSLILKTHFNEIQFSFIACQAYLHLLSDSGCYQPDIRSWKGSPVVCRLQSGVSRVSCLVSLSCPSCPEFFKDQLMPHMKSCLSLSSGIVCLH